MSTIEIATTEIAPRLDKKQTLLDAAALIEEYGHLKGHAGCPDSGFCAGGAAFWAAYGRSFVTDAETAAIAAMFGLAAGPRDGTAVSIWAVATWNDKDERTKDEVVTALRRLAEGATWEEAIA